MPKFDGILYNPKFIQWLAIFQNNLKTDMSHHVIFLFPYHNLDICFQPVNSVISPIYSYLFITIKMVVYSIYLGAKYIAVQRWHFLISTHMKICELFTT